MTTKPTLPTSRANGYVVTGSDYTNDILTAWLYLTEVLAGTNTDKIPGSAMAAALVLANAAAGQIPLVLTGPASASVDAFQANSATNGGRAAVDKNGNLYRQQTAVPTTTAGTGAGTTPTITVAANSTDQSGQLTVSTGTAPAASNATLVQVFFKNPMANAPRAVIITPANAAAAALSGTSMPFVSFISASVFNISVGSVALAASTGYIWWYLVL